MKAYTFICRWSAGSSKKTVTARNLIEARNLMRAYLRQTFPNRKYTIQLDHTSTHTNEIDNGILFLLNIRPANMPPHLRLKSPVKVGA